MFLCKHQLSDFQWGKPNWNYSHIFFIFGPSKRSTSNMSKTQNNNQNVVSIPATKFNSNQTQPSSSNRRPTNHQVPPPAANTGQRRPTGNGQTNRGGQNQGTGGGLHYDADALTNEEAHRRRMWRYGFGDWTAGTILARPPRLVTAS